MLANQKESIRLKEATEEEVKLGLVISSIRGERKINRALIGKRLMRENPHFLLDSLELEHFDAI